MQTFIYCRVTLHVSGVTEPIIRSTKNCNRYGHNTGTATSFQRGLIRTGVSHGNMEIYGTATQATVDNTVWRRKGTICMPDN